jgi:hypothetical protein
MNKRKAVIMLFTAGGRTAIKEFIAYEGFRLEMASALKCLGTIIQATCYIYTKTRLLQQFETYRTKKPNALPLNTATKFSNVKAMPSLAYGLNLVWFISVRCRVNWKR